MNTNTRILFIHGLESNSQTYKATILRNIFPDILIPDFAGPLEERMAQLNAVIAGTSGWTIIGSSLGGLMATLFAARHPAQVSRLVLLAPALTLPAFSENLPEPLAIPTTIIHGTQDDVVPLEPVRELAEKIFTNLTYKDVNDDHRLHKTAEALDWKEILA